jgi:hypothetical protein
MSGNRRGTPSYSCFCWRDDECNRQRWQAYCAAENAAVSLREADIPTCVRNAQKSPASTRYPGGRQFFLLIDWET